MEFDPRIFMFAVFGLGLILAVSLEKWLARMWLSLPIVYVGVGYVLFSLPLGLPHINPTVDGFDAVALEYVTEFIVIASLAAAGIAIDRPANWKNWRQIWPLLLIAMPLTILAVSLLGWWALGLAPASALLLGAYVAERLGGRVVQGGDAITFASPTQPAIHVELTEVGEGSALQGLTLSGDGVKVHVSRDGDSKYVRVCSSCPWW